MAIAIKAADYERIVDEFGISINKIDETIDKLKSRELYYNINSWIAFSTFVVTIVASVITGDLYWIGGVVAMIVGTLINNWFNFNSNFMRGFLDDKIFNEFLIKKIKIFYQNDDLSNFKYSKMKQISKKIPNSKNEHQAIIELAYVAYEEGAEGIIITDSNLSNVIVNATHINYKTNVNTVTFHSATATLIKDIKNIKETETGHDIEYWFDLKEKGAITEAEFLEKKRELL